MADRTIPADQDAAAGSGAAELLGDELRVWMRVLGTAGTVEQRFAKHVKQAFGISHEEFLVLCLLADQPGHTLRMTRIAELLGRPKTRLTYQVGCLHHSGLVRRESVRGDRRGVALTLTDKARRLLAEQSADLGETVQQALAELLGRTGYESLAALLAAAPFDACGAAHAPESESAATD